MSLLQQAVADALAVAHQARSRDHGLFFQLLALRDSSDIAPPAFKALLADIKRTPALECFDHARQKSLGFEQQVDLLFLVEWLVARAQQVGAQQSVLDLARYLNTDTLTVTEALTVAGVEVTSATVLGEYTIVPWHELPMSEQKWHFSAEASYSSDLPSVVFQRKKTIPRVHRRPWHAETYEGFPSIEPALDVLRCMTVVAGVGSRPLHYWIAAEDWAPWKTFYQRVDDGANRKSFTSAKLGDAEVCRIKETVAKFVALDTAEQVRLRIPMDRLNRTYRKGMKSVDSAIDLGIALESVYAPAKLSEGIGRAIRTRAARFLGGSLDERRQTDRAVKDLYALRSAAIHSGSFVGHGSDKKWHDESNVREALGRGQALIAKSLVKLIHEGEPNWDDFDLLGN
jgi:hypothetical protein